MEPTHPDKLVENVTAPSAGGFPAPDGENSRRGAEARWRFRVGLEGGDQCSTPCLWGRFIRFTVSNHPSLFQESS